MKRVFVFSACYFLLNSAFAQIYNPSTSAATGGTGRAAVEAGDAVYLNPATLVHLKGHHLFTSFAKDEFAISFSDSTPDSILPSALGYLQKKTEVSQGDLKSQTFHLSLAEFVVAKWAMGLTAHYTDFSLPNSSYRQVNGDLGLVYTPQPHIGWALVVYNIMGENSDIPEAFRPKTSVAAGFNYIYESMVRFRLDATSDSIFMGGIETYINQFLITRFGYSQDTDDDRALFTAGAGFKGPRFALSYAYQGNTQNSGDYRHSVDLEIPF